MFRSQYDRYRSHLRNVGVRIQEDRTFYSIDQDPDLLQDCNDYEFGDFFHYIF